MLLSPDFTFEELTATEHREFIQMNQDLARRQPILDNLTRLANELLQPLRDRIGLPLIVTSGFRCPDLNQAVGSGQNSQHILGEAADIHCHTLTPRELCEEIRAAGVPFGQLILEMESWAHVSLPGGHRGECLIAEREGETTLYRPVRDFTA